LYFLNINFKFSNVCSLESVLYDKPVAELEDKFAFVFYLATTNTAVATTDERCFVLIPATF